MHVTTTPPPATDRHDAGPSAGGLSRLVTPLSAVVAGFVVLAVAAILGGLMSAAGEPDGTALRYVVGTAAAVAVLAIGLGQRARARS